MSSPRTVTPERANCSESGSPTYPRPITDIFTIRFSTSGPEHGVKPLWLAGWRHIIPVKGVPARRQNQARPRLPSFALAVAVHLSATFWKLALEQAIGGAVLE